MRVRRGQVSVEFSIIFVITVIAIAFLFSTVYNQITTIGTQKEEAEVDKALSDISMAARDVYAEGEGASRKVRIELPATYDPAGSLIQNNTVLIKVRDTFKFESFDFPVEGTLPAAPGVSEITITSRGNSVFIGSSLFRMSTSLLSTVIPPSSSQTLQVTIYNLLNESLTVNASVYWPSTEVSLALSETDFTLDAYEERTINFDFSSSNTSGGNSGSVTFNANSSTLTDTQMLGIYAEIPSQGGGNGTPGLLVNPLVWVATIGSGASGYADFIICAQNAQINSVTFTPAGSTASWISGTSSIGPIAADTCQNKRLTMNVPGSASPGTYNGTITVTGDGTYTEYINDSITVVVANMTVSPQSWNASVQSGATVYMPFLVCSENIDIATVRLKVTKGIPGAWVRNTTSFRLGYNKCYQKYIYITVPNGTYTGTYNGTITFKGDGGYSVGIPFSISVTSQYNSIAVQDISHSPMPAYSNSTITVTAYANGSQNGGKTITECRLLLDDTTSYRMNAIDGSYNSASENVTVSIGQLAKGQHRAQITCTDSGGQNSQQYSYTFNVYKHFLFVYEGSTPTASESAWVSWINSQNKWLVDTAYSANITAGTVNENYYEALVYGNWSASASTMLKLKMQLFIANGRAIAFLGDSLVNAPKDFGASASAGGTTSDTAVYVTNSTHYITSGYSGSTTVSSPAQNFGKFTLLNSSYQLAYVGAASDTCIAQVDNAVYYGATSPSSFNSDGSTLATRTLDRVLSISVITE